MYNFPEFQYLKNLLSYRLGEVDDMELPVLPPVEEWMLPAKSWIQENVTEDGDLIAPILLIALAPHVVPELFDNAIQDKLKTAGDFPEIGGMRGKNFRGFIPTGQTVIFLLAGDNWEIRSKVERLFWSDKIFARRKILWLEELPQSEPVMSGKIIVALDYVDNFLFGEAAAPHFSTTFPAKRIESELYADDIVLNDEVQAHFKYLKDWISFNDQLMNRWGMEKRLRKGFRVLFYGPPGTGKTLTAAVLGNETKKDVYKIDLSMVVSKYIGETEKNLELLFARAEDKDWILFFDEADAIFGKRTSVRDAHDKYANQEVSYLLQRIEDYNGMVILATNMKNNIDDAFIRRFNDLVKFTIPNEEQRKEIWEKSFPANAQVDDIPEKVKRYEITGGNIINVIQFAGIRAVKEASQKEEGEKLIYKLDDVEEGIRHEMVKEGRPFK